MQRVDRLVHVQNGEVFLSSDHENDLEEGSIISLASSTASPEPFHEQNSDVEEDILERLGATEQSRNMNLFEQLRAWQAEQRDQLIRQQQQQLLELQAEQQAAESQLLVKRQNLWSSSKSVLSPVTASALPQKASLRKVQLGLPQAIASSTLALTRMRLQESLMVNNELAAAVNKPLVVQSPPPPEEQATGDVDQQRSMKTSTPELQCDSLLESDSDISDNQSSETEAKPDSGLHVPADTEFVHRPAAAAGMHVYEYDELPIASLAGQGKSFEEMVEEQLEREHDMPALEQQQHCGRASEKSKQGKSFLRKGEGTARFKKPHEQVNVRKASVHSRHLKQATSCDSKNVRLLETSPSASLVVQPACRKLYSRKAKVQNEDDAPELDTLSENIESTTSVANPGFVHSHNSTQESLNQLATCENSKGRDSIGDASYLACMQARATKDEAEVEELQEFELLERYVDDNASFTSNASSISRILARHDAKHSSNADMHQQSNSCVQGSVISGELGMKNELDKEDMYTDEECSNGDSDDDINSTLVDDKDVLNEESHLASAGNLVSLMQPTALQTIYRKISSFSGKTSGTEPQSVSDNKQRMFLSSKNTTQSPPVCVQNKADISVPVAASKVEHKSVQSVSCEKDDAEHNDAVQSYKILCSSGGAATLEGIITENVFCDEREWNDSIVSSPGQSHNDLHSTNWKKSSERSPVDNMASASSSDAQLSVETGYYTSDMHSSDSPPISKLAQKLFPKLKPHSDKTTASKLSPCNEVLPRLAPAANSQADDTPAAASSALREKLAQLELEIQQFRSENVILTTLRKEREQVVTQLKKEMAEFEHQKADELQRLENFKAEEIKKLKKERKVFETYQKTARARPDKKDREEIEMLKCQLSDLQDEVKRKEQKWTASNQRLRDRIEQLEQENTELQQEIRVLEQKRIQDWKPRKNDPVPAAKSDAKFSESTFPIQDTAPQSLQKHEDMLKNPPKPQQHIAEGRRSDGKVEHATKSLSSAAPSNPPSTPNLDVSDETVRHTNNAPKPQASSPSTTNGYDAVRTLSATRKTAPKTSTIQSTEMVDRPYDQVQHSDGKVERVCQDGSREILFTNGTRKQISSDGQTIIVSYFNGDIKQILPDGRVVYYYADARTMHTTYADGLQIFQFAHGQVEKHYIDGTIEIQFPDQTIKYLFPDGSAESVLLDGAVVHEKHNGEKQITFPNGQKEVHTAMYRKREYPDGTTKTIFNDGRQETRYSNGRLRVKDANGVVIVDRLT